MIDLAPHHLATVCRILAEQAPECEVRAFGSRVTGRARTHSDLDLAVISSGKIPLVRLGVLREAFQECELPIRVDVLDWHRISAAFRAVIEKDSEIVQRSSREMIAEC